MSVAWCWHHALRIAEKPRAEWAAAIAELPASCDKSDCGQPHNCRERIGSYLRVQWQASRNRSKR